MADWIDREDGDRNDKLRRDEILKAKAYTFWDSVFESVKRDVTKIKERRSLDIIVLRPEPNEIHIQKKMPYPTFSVVAVLDVLSVSVKIQWVRTDGRDQKSYQKPTPTRWNLRLDSHDELIVSAGEDEINADKASELLLRPALNA